MRVYLLFHFQTKGKVQTCTVSDIEKYLLKTKIQDWRNFDLQRYKVRKTKTCVCFSADVGFSCEGCLL